ncbi:hypothetical protein [Iningainema tapete]|uniref:DUF2203 domain-containing protein n=1 Tax=Iningainema tapete BLCC-T55 TaxID=2748662 RepID=A0A8J6XMK7_9CYAN|nr:hypothetical protein [Iningainema tapete]MBD2774559.1 hypothetical protein [Iningainema tapete BLCC-T55]
MKQRKKSFESPDEDNQDFERELIEVEGAIVALRERYTQVQADKAQQEKLKQASIQLNKHKYLSPEMKAELKQIQQQLSILEINLESQLFSWGNLKKPFWQAVRFGGLGVIIGWILKSFVG